MPKKSETGKTYVKNLKTGKEIPIDCSFSIGTRKLPPGLAAQIVRNALNKKKGKKKED